jgi:hypothetical protein
MSTECQRTCTSCGNEFSGAMEFCPVCMLRKALGGGVQSDEPFAPEALLEKDPARRFQSPDELLKAIPTIIVAIDTLKYRNNLLISYL